MGEIHKEEGGKIMKKIGVITRASFSISLKKELSSKLHKHCEDNGRSISKFISILVENYFEMEEKGRNVSESEINPGVQS